MDSNTVADMKECLRKQGRQMCAMARAHEELDALDAQVQATNEWLRTFKVVAPRDRVDALETQTKWFKGTTAGVLADNEVLRSKVRESDEKINVIYETVATLGMGALTLDDDDDEDDHTKTLQVPSARGRGRRRDAAAEMGESNKSKVKPEAPKANPRAAKKASPANPGKGKAADPDPSDKTKLPNSVEAPLWYTARESHFPQETVPLGTAPQQSSAQPTIVSAPNDSLMMDDDDDDDPAAEAKWTATWTPDPVDGPLGKHWPAYLNLSDERRLALGLEPFEGLPEVGNGDL